MRKILSTCLFIILLLMSLSLLSQNDFNVAGYITTRDGKTINFIRIDSNNKEFRFIYGPEEKETTLFLYQIKRIDFGEGSTAALIELKDGKKIKAKSLLKNRAAWVRGEIKIFYWDEIAKTENFREIPFDLISQIVIGNNAGHFRQCKQCNSFWPDSFLFCPKDGTQTVWAEY